METETKYHQKEKWQIQQCLVTKAVTLVLVIGFISCSSKAQIENNSIEYDVYKIINNELNALVPKINTDEIFLDIQLNNHLIGNFDNLKFNEESYEYHFLMTFYSLSKKDYEYLFNEYQINYYKQQLKDENLIDSSKIKNKKLTMINLKNEKNIASLYNDKGLITLSNPVFSKNNKFAIINFYFGDYNRNAGNEGITIYKKENKKWILYRRILLGIV